MVKTCEFVSPGHPDKICDFIADKILDAYLAKDPLSRVAVEVMGGHGVITVSGEITSLGQVDIESVVRTVVGAGFRIAVNVSPQSSEIAQGVDEGGAGDQGIMTGYACGQTRDLLPLEYVLARDLCREVFRKYPFDGKVQITLREDKVAAVVASFQNAPSADLAELVKRLIKADEYLINPAGEWSKGGFDADSGLSGRKLVVDNYGPEVSIGGGSFSGKDCTKVDRSGAYMARKIAVDYLRRLKAKEVNVKLAYAIGKRDPVMAIASVDGEEVPVAGYDLTPKGISDLLGLAQPIYARTSQWGHFGRGFSWDN